MVVVSIAPVQARPFVAAAGSLRQRHSTLCGEIQPQAPEHRRCRPRPRSLAPPLHLSTLDPPCSLLAAAAPREGPASKAAGALLGFAAAAALALSPGPAAAGESSGVRLPPLDNDPLRCERAYMGNTIGQANAVSDRPLDLRYCDFTGKVRPRPAARRAWRAAPAAAAARCRRRRLGEPGVQRLPPPAAAASAAAPRPNYVLPPPPPSPITHRRARPHHSPQDLHGKTLSGALLVGTNLTNANLAEVVMSKAYAVGANFTGANLTNAVVDRVAFDTSDMTGERERGGRWQAGRAEARGATALGVAVWREIYAARGVLNGGGGPRFGCVLLCRCAAGYHALYACHILTARRAPCTPSPAALQAPSSSMR